MRVRIDRNACQGHGQCTLLAADVFSLDDEGIAIALIERPPENLREATMRAVRACPVRAITISEE